MGTPTVFVSHSSADRRFVEQELIPVLESHALDTWYSRNDVTLAADFQSEIRAAMKRCEWFLVVLSPRSVASEWVRAEVAWAMTERQERFIPVLLEPCEVQECHLQLPLRQLVDFADDSHDARTRLLGLLTSGRTAGAHDPVADELTANLRRIRDERDAGQVVTLFRSLADPRSELRTRALQAIHAIGWPSVLEAVLDVARSGEPESTGHLLNGLTALESNPEGVRILDRLVDLLEGETRNRAILLAERKRLGLRFETIRELFRRHDAAYELVEVLGQGVFAASFLARHRQTSLEAVVRVLRPELVRDARLRSDFSQLVGRSMRHVHQHLVIVRDVGQFPDAEVYYSVRDFVDGLTLQDLLDGERRLETSQLLQILTAITAALETIHGAGEVHGAIKPSNVYLESSGRVVLGDPSLPITRAAGSKRLSYDYQYVAPELFVDEPQPTPASDVYAVGCLAYHLACGRPPHVSESTFELARLHVTEPVSPCSRQGSRFGPSWDHFLDRLLTRDPNERPSIEMVRTMLPELKFGRADADDVDRLFDSILRDSEPVPHSICAVEDPGDAFQTMLGPTPGGDGPVATLDVPPDSDLSGVRPPHAADQTIDTTFATGEPHVGRNSSELPRFSRFEILKTLGQGAFGVVYLARDTALERLVALKVPHHTSMEHGRDRRFLVEARVSASLRHPNIVPIYDVGEEKGVMYFASAFIEGTTLADVEKSTPLGFRTAVEWIEALARALAYAHGMGVVHRDVKPHNVIIDGTGQPHLMDFGLARQAEDAGELTVEGTVLGTPAYMSPEQARGESSRVGPLSDQFSLGLTLYELITGSRPHEGPVHAVLAMRAHGEPPRPPRSINPSIPRDLEAICLRAIENEPERRYESMDAMADDLARWLEGDPVDSRPRGLVDRLLGWFRRP